MNRCIVLVALLVLPLPAGASSPEPQPLVTLSGVPAVPDPMASPCDANGNPMATRPRPSVPIATPAVRGGELFADYWVVNQGRTPFEGDIVMEVPEINLTWRERLPIPIAPACWDGTGGQMFAFIFLLLAIPVEEDWPANVTIIVRFEDLLGAPAGEESRTDHLVRETLCGPQEDDEVRGIVFTAGQKRIVRPYDPILYSFTVCNDDEIPHDVIVLIQDPSNGRILRHEHILVSTREHNGWMASFMLEDPLVTEDLAPRITLIWDDGLIQSYIGDSMTFAPPAARSVLGIPM